MRGENCAAVSPANSSVAGDISYKNLASFHVVLLHFSLISSAEKIKFLTSVKYSIDLI